MSDFLHRNLYKIIFNKREKCFSPSFKLQNWMYYFLTCCVVLPSSPSPTYVNILRTAGVLVVRFRKCAGLSVCSISVPFLRLFFRSS